MKKRIFIFVALLCLLLAGCSQTAEPQDSDPADTGTSSIAPADPIPPADDLVPPAEVATTDEPAVRNLATLYIGTKSVGFQEYPMDYAGDLTPELLIQGIADLTGWDLTLAEAVTTGKGGMSVCLSNGSALFVGPPEPQRDEFHMFSAEQLAETLLDSIQKTLQMGFTGVGGDPDALDIYYYMEGEQPLELPDVGLSWPLDQPYQWPLS